MHSFPGKSPRQRIADKDNDSNEFSDNDKAEGNASLLDLPDNDTSDFPQCSPDGATGSEGRAILFALSASDYSIWMADEYNL